MRALPDTVIFQCAAMLDTIKGFEAGALRGDKALQRSKNRLSFFHNWPRGQRGARNTERGPVGCPAIDQGRPLASLNALSYVGQRSRAILFRGGTINVAVASGKRWCSSEGQLRAEPAGGRRLLLLSSSPTSRDIRAEDMKPPLRMIQKHENDDRLRSSFSLNLKN
jgi:hypothetical protein